MSPKDTETLKRFTEWTKRDDSCYYIVSVGKCYLLKEMIQQSFAMVEIMV